MNKKKQYSICYIVTIPLTIRSFFIPQLTYLQEKGINVTVICQYEKNFGKELKNINYIPVNIPRGIDFLGMIRALLKLIKIFRKNKYDMIQYSTPNAAFISSLAGCAAGIKIRNYHMMGIRYLGFHGAVKNIFKIIEKVTCMFSTSVECVSKTNLKLCIKERLFKPEKGTVVWNGSTGGVDLNKFDYSKRKLWRNEIRNKLGYSEKDFVYGFVGRITKDKGINELLTAFLALKDDSKLLIVGSVEKDNHLDARLLKKAYEYPNIIFHDFVSDIERYYAAMDVLILPSYREGFGNVVIEAGAVGTPAIVTDIPGPMDTIVKMKTALSIPAKNILKLEQAMKKIRILDYKQMGQFAAEFSSNHFDCEKLNQKVFERKSRLLGLVE